MVKCTNCGDDQVVWSQNMRLNSKGLMKHWLMNVNTGQDHKCMSWSKQGGRDAIIPDSGGWQPGELEALRASVARKDKIRLDALEALFKPNLSERKEVEKEKTNPNIDAQTRL